MTAKEAKERILLQIAFEERWLHDVLKEDGKISNCDIKIAMDGIRVAVNHIKEVSE